MLAQKLSPIQIHFLRFFSEREIDDQETYELQKIIANYYLTKADSLMEKIWVEKDYSEQKMIELLDKKLDVSKK